MRNNNFLSIMITLTLISIFIAGCKAAKEEQITQSIEEVADTGALNIDSTPRLAQVYVGEEYRGDTPLELYNLPVGQYDITVKKDGYIDFKKAITIKVGRTEEIDAILTPILQEEKIAEEKKQMEEAMSQNVSTTIPKLNKINLSAFAMYYDFDKIEFTEIRADGSDLFSRKYDIYIHFTALTPAKIYVLNKPIRDAQKEDCIFGDTAVAQLFSGQTLCVKTGAGNIAAIGGIWQTMPVELEWVELE